MMTYETSDLTQHQVVTAYRRIDDLHARLRAVQEDLEPGERLIATETQVRQYRRLLHDLRSSGIAIANWHDPELDPDGTRSGNALRDSLDVLTKLVEDATDTWMPTGSPV